MKKRVVIVDDDPFVLKLMVKILRSLHFEIYDFEKSQIAIDVMSDFDRKVHLLVTDLIMPDVSGEKVMEIFQEKYPEIKIICVSGNSDPKKRGEKCNCFIHKPFTVKEFKNKVKELFPS